MHLKAWMPAMFSDVALFSGCVPGLPTSGASGALRVGEAHRLLSAAESSRTAGEAAVCKGKAVAANVITGGGWFVRRFVVGPDLAH